MMTTTADIELFRAWQNLVLPFNLADFIDGSNYISAEKSAAFRTTHLDLIRQRINSARHALVRRQIEEDNQDERTCSICFGPGIAQVPHPNCVRDCQWLPPYTTAGIYCACQAGQAKFRSLTDAIHEAHSSRKTNVFIPKEPLEWAKYEAMVPNWQQLLEWREELRKTENRAKNMARHADLEAPLRTLIDKAKRLTVQ